MLAMYRFLSASINRFLVITKLPVFISMRKEWWIPERKTEQGERSIVEERLRHKHFYSSQAWRKFRNYVLSIFEPICDCGRLITDSKQIHLHHVHTLSTPDGWRLRLSLYDDDNQLNILVKCDRCHLQLDAQYRREAKQVMIDKLSDAAMKEFDL